MVVLVACLGTADADPDFRAARIAVEMPRDASNVVEDLMRDKTQAREILDHVADVFEVPRGRVDVGSLTMDGYRESEGGTGATHSSC